MKPNFITIANISLFFISIFIVAKSSDIPLLLPSIYGIPHVFGKFPSGNQEIFSIFASIIAAYIFYIINVLLPHHINRKKSLEIIDSQLTQVMYRSMSLLYIHEDCKGLLKEKTVNKAYKLIAYDLDEKIRSIVNFIDYLKIEERMDLNIISSYKNKFMMKHHKIDVVAKKINDSIIGIARSINLPSGHINDKEWYKIENGKISFIKESSTFKLLLLDLYELSPQEAIVLPDFSNLVDISRLEQEESDGLKKI